VLTSDLVQVRVYRDEVRPRYLPDDEGSLGLAAQLIEVFSAHVGQPRHELDRELADLLGTGTAFVLHRGLAKLLLDRCGFETDSPVDPESLRRDVFAAAAEHRRGEDRFDRAAVLGQVAAARDLDPDALERGLYADLKDEQVLQDWKPCTPEWLVRRYNVALAQGVLLRAHELTIRIGGLNVRKYRSLFRKIKFFQLLHRIEGTRADGYVIRLDGPMSIFQASGKYGLQMASFLPTLLHFEGWELAAELRWGARRRHHRFVLTPATGLQPLSRLTGQWQPEELAWFPEQFAKLESDWTVSTDGELVDLGGKGVLVPDFVFEHKETGRRVFMEVFGFWNKGAVTSRLRLLKRHGPANLILALSKQLAAGHEGLEDLPGEVYVFRASPIARRVLKVLKASECR